MLTSAPGQKIDLESFITIAHSPTCEVIDSGEDSKLGHVICALYNSKAKFMDPINKRPIISLYGPCEKSDMSLYVSCDNVIVVVPLWSQAPAGSSSPDDIK